MPTALHVTPYLGEAAGGPPVVVRQLTSHARDEGWDARIVTTPAYGDEHAADKLRADGIMVLPSQRAAFTPAGYRQLAAAVRGADIVHCHTLWSPLVALSAAIARRSGIPYVLSPHGMLDPYSLGQKRVRKAAYLAAIERRLIDRAASVLYTTQSEQDLASRSIASDTPGAVVALGADRPPGSVEALSAGFFARHPDLAGKPLIIFLGRLHGKKRPEKLVEAMPAIRAALPDATLLLVGPGDDATTGRLKTLRDHLALGDGVRFLGLLSGEPKWQALASARVFVLPSQQENFGIAVAEALHAGVPVLLTKHVNIWHELVEAGAGMAIEEEDLVADLAAQTIAIIGDPGKRASMSRSARNLANRAYNWPACARETFSLYNAIIASSRTS